MRHKHFTVNEREYLLEYLAWGYNYEKIATKLKKHKSSISREIKKILLRVNIIHIKLRNSTLKEKNCGAKRKLDNSILLIDIQNKLEKG